MFARRAPFCGGGAYYIQTNFNLAHGGSCIDVMFVGIYVVTPLLLRVSR